MWLMTNIGFFSVVEKPSDREAGKLTVRSRSREDLEDLVAQHLPNASPILENAGTDYPYRIRITREDFAIAVAQLVREIDYSNFKDEVHARRGLKRAKVYGKVWRDLLAIEKGNA